jgi:hypothetical protein
MGYEEYSTSEFLILILSFLKMSMNRKTHIKMCETQGLQRKARLVSG